MSEESPDPQAANQPAPPHKIGVVLGELGRVNVPALKYLIVHLNTLQTVFEFEILPTPAGSKVVSQLDGRLVMSRDLVRERLGEFHDDLRRHVAAIEQSILPLKLAVSTIPEDVVLLTMGRFEQGSYTVGDRAVRAVALGHWKRELAPPSILEFFVTLLLRQSIGLISPTFRSSGHLGTKGCLFDFTDDLGDARLKTMQGFVCSDCRRLLARDNRPALLDALLPVLNTRNWLGSPDDPKSPAATVAKLGHDLFLTRGVEPSWKEAVFAKLRDEGVKELIRIAAVVVGTVLVVLLGLIGLKSGS